MITQTPSHDDYLPFITSQIDLMYPNIQFIRDHFFDLIVWISQVYLTETTNLLKHRYPPIPEEENRAT